MLFLSALFSAFLASYTVSCRAIGFYLLIRYGVGRSLISGVDFAIGTAVGVVTVGTFLTVGPTALFPRLVPRVR